MAKQSSHINFQGSIGGITYVKTPDGFYARPKTVIPKARFATDPAFKRLREHNAEFSRAGKATKLIRESVKVYLKNAKDRKTSTRLTTQMLQIVIADNLHKKGQRKVLGPQFEKLDGFNFNEGAKLSDIFGIAYTTSIDRATGKLEISIPSFVPENIISGPEGSTHFQLISVGVEIDFDKEAFVEHKADSGLVPLSDAATNLITLTHNLPAASTSPLFLVLGILFHEEVNGFSQPITKSAAFNALSIVKISGS